MGRLWGGRSGEEGVGGLAGGSGGRGVWATSCTPSRSIHFKLRPEPLEYGSHAHVECSTRPSLLHAPPRSSMLFDTAACSFPYTFMLGHTPSHLHSSSPTPTPSCAFTRGHTFLYTLLRTPSHSLWAQELADRRFVPLHDHVLLVLIADHSDRQSEQLRYLRIFSVEWHEGVSLSTAALQARASMRRDPQPASEAGGVDEAVEKASSSTAQSSFAAQRPRYPRPKPRHHIAGEFHKTGHGLCHRLQQRHTRFAAVVQSVLLVHVRSGHSSVHVPGRGVHPLYPGH